MKKVFIKIIAVFLTVLTVSSFSNETRAQELETVVHRETYILPPYDDYGQLLDNSEKNIVRYSMFVFVPTVTFLFGVKAWSWETNHEFWTKREGWFSEKTSFGGADKCGHFFAHYTLERGLVNVFDYLDNGSNRKYIEAAALTCAIGLMIEVGDSWSASYGFGVEDLVMDYSGVLVGHILERYPIADSFVGVSCEYIPTLGYMTYYKHNTGKTVLTFVNDYSGWRWMVNLKMAGFEYNGFDAPEFLRYVSLDLGYGTRGYSSYDKGKYVMDKRRDVFVGISLNSTEVVKDLFNDHTSRAARIASKPFEFYHPPIGYKSIHNLND